MTDTEFDILDELYFVTSFGELQSKTGLPETALLQVLRSLVAKGYVKCLYPDPDLDVAFDEQQFAAHYREYYFLATKAGLLRHNSR